MGKLKEEPRYNVVSMRISDQEKAALIEMTRKGRTTIAGIMREALRQYLPRRLATLQEGS